MKNLSDKINELAYAEGWGICYVPQYSHSACHNKYELQRIHPTREFESDNEAAIFVALKAIENPNFHYGEALKFLEEESPNEFYNIIATAVGKDKFDKLKNVLNIS